MAKLYIITGPAGVGKSTVTKKLAEKIGKCAVLEGDEIYHQVWGAASPWQDGNHLEVMWKNMIDLTTNYLNAGIDVVLNYIIYKENLERLLKVCEGFEVHFVLLWANKETVAFRDEARGEEFQVNRVDKHLKSFLAQNYEEKHFLHNDNKTVEQEVDEILSGKFKCK